MSFRDYKKVWDKNWPLFYTASVIGIITYMTGRVSSRTIIFYIVLFMVLQMLANWVDKINFITSIKRISESILLITFTLVINYAFNFGLSIRFIILYGGAVVLNFIWSFITYKLKI